MKNFDLSTSIAENTLLNSEEQRNACGGAGGRQFVFYVRTGGQLDYAIEIFVVNPDSQPPPSETPDWALFRIGGDRGTITVVGYRPGHPPF